MRQLLHRCLLLVAALAAMAPASAEQQALTVPRSLDQLTERAAFIMRGNVVSAIVEKHPELNALDTVVVTLRVRESLKGVNGQTFTFRQYLWDARGPGVAGGYYKGQDLLLLMLAPSRYGLSSPAGLEQGRFRIHRDATGREVAVNGRANYKLLDGADAELARQGKTVAPGLTKLIQNHRKGPVALDELTALIREFSRERR